METKTYSRLDKDLYKDTMAHAFIKADFHNKQAFGRQRVRNNISIGDIHKKIQENVEIYANTTITSAEKDFLKSYGIGDEKLAHLSKPIDLTGFEFEHGTNGFVFENTLLNVSEIELALMHITSEEYARKTLGKSFEAVEDAMIRNNIKKARALANKINQVRQLNPDFKFNMMEFGTRRRYSLKVQVEAINALMEYLPKDVFNSTSNQKIAMDTGLTCVGTHAHEYQQVFQVKYGFRGSIAEAVKHWQSVYGNLYDTVLTDTLGYAEYYQQMVEHNLLHTFTGERHDSADPFEWALKVLENHKKHNIDSNQRKLVFTDSLNYDKAIELAMAFGMLTKCVFGIGTFITNDINFPEMNAFKAYGLKVLQQVYKIEWFDNCPVVKLSDNFEKSQGGSDDAINFAKTCVRK